MRSGVRIFAALGGDMEPVLACGWLLSMNPGVAVTAGPLDRGPGAGPWAHGFMDLRVLKRDRDDDALLRAAAAETRRIAARIPGDGAFDLSRDPPVGRFDLLLVGKPQSGNPAYPNADGRQFRAVLVAPRETPSCLGRSVTILADGPPRDLTSFGIARHLFPTIASVHLILDGPADPDRVAEWLRLLDCRCPVRVSAAWQTAAITDTEGDLLVVERPARFWRSVGFEKRLTGLLHRTPGAILFAL